MIGERISELRKRKSMTQKQLAEYLSVSPNSISLYERNLSTPDDETKIRLARLFDVSMDYLMGTSDRETPLDQKEKAAFLYLKNLPMEARTELEAFLRYLREKYHL